MRTKIIFIISILFACFCMAAVSCKNKPGKVEINKIDSVPVAVSHSFWDTLPPPAGYINDFEGIYTPVQKAALDSILANYEKEAAVQVCIATLDTSATTAGRFDELALYMARTWGVGNKDRSNGIMIAVSSGYHRMKICNGAGIEKYLDNDETQQIINEGFIPGFKNGDYYGGTINGLSMLIAELNKKMHAGKHT